MFQVTENGKYCLILVFEAKALLLSDFENNDEENIGDAYFKEYVDVGVEDVLDEVVRSSQLMMVEHNETEQRNTVEDREENVTVCYLTMNQRRLKKLMLMD